MAISAEEQRALDFQQSLAKRAHYKRQQELALRGDTHKRRQLQENWNPVIHLDDAFGADERASTPTASVWPARLLPSSHLFPDPTLNPS